MTVGQDMLQRVWDEIAFRCDVFRFTKGTHTEHLWPRVQEHEYWEIDLVWSVVQSFAYVLAKEHSLFSLSSRYEPKKKLWTYIYAENNLNIGKLVWGDKPFPLRVLKRNLLFFLSSRF